MTVPIVQLSEVAVVVSDLDRSVRFYTEVLGMALWEREPDHATVRCGNGFIGLWLPGAGSCRPPDGGTLRARGRCRQHFNFWIHNGTARPRSRTCSGTASVTSAPATTRGRGPHRLRGPGRPPARVLGRDSFEAPPDKKQ